MSLLNFKYNLEKDAWNWVRTAKDKDVFGLDWKKEVVPIPPHLLEKLVKESQAQGKKLAQDWIQNNKNFSYKKELIEKEIEALSLAWAEKEKIFIERLEKITGKPFKRRRFAGYFTTLFICPYDYEEAWFMVSMWHSLPRQIGTICHELLHFHFIDHYRELLLRKGLSEKNFEDLKESLTFLLNVEFTDICLVEEEGYPDHQNLRKRLELLWKEKQDFNWLIEKTVEEFFLKTS